MEARVVGSLTLGDIYVELQKARLEASDIFKSTGFESYVSLVSRFKGVPNNDMFELLGNRIALMREQDFDYFYHDQSGRKVLIKDNINHDPSKLNPIHRYEAQLQMYRYLRGALLIIENADPQLKNVLYEKIKIMHDDLFFVEIIEEKSLAELVLRFADKLTDLTAQHVYPNDERYDPKENATHLKNMRKQLTMARDLAILLEDQPVVCTVSNEAGTDKVSIERATLTKVSKEYYQSSILKYPFNQDWFKAAKRFAGLEVKDNHSWLDHFFDSHFAEVAARGVPVPPSARWLPIPANTQLMETVVGVDDGILKILHELSFVRTGIIVPYDIRNIPGKAESYSYQKEVALEILKEVVSQYLEKAIKEFKEIYLLGPNEKFDFYVSYQTLLTPIPLEKRRNHVDNNARFVESAKQVVMNLSKDTKFIAAILEKTGANLIFSQTNSAVNRNAPVAVNDDADMKTRIAKIKSFEKFHQRLYAKQGYSRLLMDHPRLAAELNIRSQACEQLSRLINKDSPYHKLKDYQYNFMMAALDNIVTGHQALNIDGCKSTRDRTGVFGCALKTMLQNPTAMSDWKLLRDGIVQSLLEGHYFRSVGYTSGIVKVDLVHKDFLRAMRKEIQQDIKQLLVFSKKLPEYTDESQKSSPPNLVKGLKAEFTRFMSGTRHRSGGHSNNASRSPSSSDEESNSPSSPSGGKRFK